MRSTSLFLLDHGLTLLTGAFVGAAITLAANNLEAIGFWGWSLLFAAVLAFIFRRLLGKSQSKFSKSIRLLSRIVTIRLLRTMPRKGEPKLRIEYLPVALFFFMLGIGLAACWEWEFWDVTSSIGSLLAGTGTVGLLWFGWTKANEWMRQLQLKKAIDIIVNELQQLLESSSQLSRIYHQALHTQKVIKITESNNIELAKVELEDIEEKASDQFGKALASIDLLVSCCLTLDNSELLLPRLEQLRAELGSVSDIHYLSGLEHTLFSF